MNALDNHCGRISCLASEDIVEFFLSASVSHMHRYNDIELKRYKNGVTKQKKAIK